MVNLSRQNPINGLAVSREAGESGPTLRIAGKRVQANRTTVLLLERLISDFGRVVSYEHLCRVLGHVTADREQRHVLRQYTLEIKRLLAEHDASHVLAVAPKRGYALCEAAA